MTKTTKLEKGSASISALHVRPTVEELTGRARAMIPTLRARGQKADEARRVSDETVAEFIEAGFHLIGQPTRFGGFGYGQDVICQVSAELSRGCGTAGWLACFFAAHNLIIGLFPEQGQIEVWGEDSPVLCSTISTAGLLAYDNVDGGIRVSGKVRFSSGIDVANWVIIIGSSGLILIPKRDYRIEDDWFVMGMKGSGSKAVVLENVFVPDRRIVRPESLATYQTYGAKHYEAIHYRLPFAVWSTTNQTSVILGMTRGLLELFDERIRSRKDPHTTQPAIERPGWQLRFAEAAAEVDAAQALFQSVHDDFQAWHVRGGDVSSEERARVRRNIVFTTKLCVQAANRLFDGGDASVVYESNAIQRFFRDIRTAAVSISQVWDEPAIQYSRVHWGLPQQTMF
jgi:alkylation response protein AidB-like acyl-CoA dehydrogenase